MIQFTSGYTASKKYWIKSTLFFLRYVEVMADDVASTPRHHQSLQRRSFQRRRRLCDADIEAALNYGMNAFKLQFLGFCQYCLQFDTEISFY